MNAAEYHRMYMLEQTHWWFLARQAYVRAILPVPDGTEKILDLGAGTGGMSGYLSRWGNVTRIESSPIAHRYLARRGLSSIFSPIESYAFPKNSHTLVCLFDVLYHRNISDDQQVLHLAYRTLKPGGHILITDSALPFLRSTHDDAMHTRERYTIRSLSRKVQLAGFAIKHSTYLYSALFPAVLIVRLMQKLFPFPSLAKPHPLVNAALLNVCVWESFLIKKYRLPIGSSLLLYAKKS